MKHFYFSHICLFQPFLWFCFSVSLVNYSNISLCTSLFLFYIFSTKSNFLLWGFLSVLSILWHCMQLTLPRCHYCRSSNIWRNYVVLEFLCFLCDCTGSFVSCVCLCLGCIFASYGLSVEVFTMFTWGSKWQSWASSSENSFSARRSRCLVYTLYFLWVGY